MNRLEEIQERMNVIAEKSRAEGVPIDTLNAFLAEQDALVAERVAIQENTEKRAELLTKIANGTVQGEVIAQAPEERKENMTAQEARSTEEYRSAFLKTLQGKALSETEKRLNEMAITDVPGVIPTLTQDRIFNKLKEYAPLLGEITLLQVAGNVTFAVEGTNNAAALHSENSLIVPAADTMVAVSLAGYEIVKMLRISATVSTMAINAFEGWLVENLAENIAAEVGKYIVYGSGSAQPKGVDYAAVWSSGTNAVIPAGATPTATELVTLVSYLKGGYKRRAKFLMNSTTFWGSVVPAQDNSKYKILTDDYSRMLGYPVMLDDNVAAGDIFFGDFKKVVGNLSQNVKVDRSTESGFAYNAVDYRGTAIFDCDIAVAEAFVKCAKVLTAGA